MQQSWREPWHWPRAWQYASFACAGLVGTLLLSPWWMSSWQSWHDATQAELALLAQQDQTQRLLAQTAQIQEARRALPMAVSDLKALGHLAESEGLQLSQLALEKAEQSPHLQALQMQQLPVRMRVQGSWQGWLNWLSRWPTDMPGVAVSSLELKADPKGGVSAQLLAVVPQNTDSEPVFELASVKLQDELDPFSAQAWVKAQRVHAAQHPSYERLVAPEMLRVRDVLEAFPRERLQYIGHIQSAAGLEALVKVLPPASDGKTSSIASVHRVRVGNHLGQDFGKVLAIGPQALIVQELALSPAGEWKTREVHLPLIEAGL